MLKNAIDHASRPYGQSAWKGKPAGVLGASVGAMGTAMAQQHLRNILAYLDVPTLGQPEAFIQVKDGLFDEDGNIGAGTNNSCKIGWKIRGLGKRARCRRRRLELGSVARVRHTTPARFYFGYVERGHPRHQRLMQSVSTLSKWEVPMTVNRPNSVDPGSVLTKVFNRKQGE